MEGQTDCPTTGDRGAALTFVSLSDAPPHTPADSKSDGGKINTSKSKGGDHMSTTSRYKNATNHEYIIILINT